MEKRNKIERVLKAVVLAGGLTAVTGLIAQKEEIAQIGAGVGIAGLVSYIIASKSNESKKTYSYDSAIDYRTLSLNEQMFRRNYELNVFGHSDIPKKKMKK